MAIPKPTRPGEKRQYPDYVSCTLPTLRPLHGGGLGQPIAGCIPVTRASDPNRDPDLPPAVIPGLYTHPRLPGLLLAVVSNSTELFRRGSSFVTGYTAGEGGLNGLVGRSAERALLGEAVPLPNVGANAAIPGHTRTMSEAERTEAHAAIAAFSRSVISGDPFMGHIYASPLTCAAGAATGLFGPALGDKDAASSDTLGRYMVDGMWTFAESATGAFNQTFMAVLTDADDGWLASGDEMSRVSYNLNFWYSVGRASDMAAHQYADWLSGLDSRARPYGPASFAAELAILKAHPDDTIWHCVTVGAVRATVGSVLQPRKVYAGRGVPYITKRSPNAHAIPSPFGAFARVGVKCEEIDDATIDSLVARALWAYSSIHDGKFVPKPHGTWQYFPGLTMNRAEEVLAGAKRMVDVTTESEVTQAATAGGWTAFPGTPAQMVVPSAAAPQPYGYERRLASSTPSTGVAAWRLRELFRRSYARVENHVRAM